MLAGEWERIKLIFEAALNVPTELRQQRLEEVCGGDEELKSVVSGLIQSHLEITRCTNEAPVLPGEVFRKNDLVAGRYRIIRFISSGGMGQVYEAFDERLHLRLALKTLRPEFASDKEALERFQREVRTAREVSHPGICRVFDLVEHKTADGSITPCLTMELIEGENLTEYLRRHGPLSPDDALPLIRQIALAVEVLHESGIIHRDLKPSNIMLTSRSDGQLRTTVMDFGLAKPFGSHSQMFETVAAIQAGAPYYMAPELLRGEMPTTKSDIYALGMIADDMVTTAKAFSATSVHTLYYQKLWEQPAAPKGRCEKLPENWNQGILGCLAGRPELRPDKPSDVVTQLAGEAAKNAVVDRRPLRWRSFASKHSWRVAGLGAVLCLLAVSALARLLTQPAHTSVVVLPIENSTGNPSYDYLCKGTTAELMRRLTLLNGLRVIPYYGPAPKEGFDTDKARFSLAGMLQESNGSLRLTESLTDNKDRALAWMQNFDHELQDPLKVQSEIAENVTQTLESGTALGPFAQPLRNILGLKVAALPQAATANSAAFEYYIRGRNLFDERTLPAALEAITCFENALAEDPKFALAEAALADTQFVLMDFSYAPEAVLLERTRQHAMNAIRLAPSVADGFISLAAAQQTAWEYAAAEKTYAEALRLNPRSALAHRWYGGMLLQFGRYDEALEQTRQAMQLDPYNAPAQAVYGYYLFLARHYQEAEKVLVQSIQQKDMMSAHIFLGDLYLQQGLLPRALAEADKVEAMVRRNMPTDSKTSSVVYADRMHAQYLFANRDPRAKPYLDRLLRSFQSGNTSPVSLALVYLATGDREKAMQLLEEAARKKDRELLYVKVSPEFDRLRNMDRFRTLLKNMNL
jgi:serine/threonine protein kinase/tetratricopeptide (TPR) repeat protein